MVSMVVRRRRGCTRSSSVSAQQAIWTMSRKAMQRRNEDSFAIAVTRGEEIVVVFVSREIFP